MVGKLFDIGSQFGAEFSPCRRYRYALYRTWSDSRPLCMFIGLNPSTADEIEDDPTIRRCKQFASDWGFGGLIMANLFAFRATDPKEMKRQGVAAIGNPANDAWLWELYGRAKLVIAAWGAHGDFLERGGEVLAMLNHDVCQLGYTASGQPKHPLYLARNTPYLPINPQTHR